MAANIPAKVKTSDLMRFVVRAGQLETAKPVIAYWCEYWIVNQILSKGLHNGDTEVLQYTTTLMDKLELIKSSNATNDAIVDDVAGQAYVEQFGFEIFQRADRAVQANQVTKQTADTFQAAATFLELVNVWGTPDAETQAKIKYAKWNAVRITKALKEGKDPNESNPKIEEKPEEDFSALDSNDLEGRGLGDAALSRHASVEEVPDEQDNIEARLARQSSIDQSLHPSAQVSARGSPTVRPTFEPYPRDDAHYAAAQDGVSPLEPSTPDRNGSVGGGYFPDVPTFTAEPQSSGVKTAPPGGTIDIPPQYQTLAPTDQDLDFSAPPVNQATAPPQDYYRQAPSSPPNLPPPPVSQHVPPRQPPPYVPPTQQYNAPPPVQVPVPALASGRQNTGPLRTDDVSIAKAQKHAKWAISALNFEDADTAVKELREALKTLGAT